MSGHGLDLRAAAASVPLPQGASGDLLARAYIGKQIESAPYTKGQFLDWCKRARGGQVPVRVRDAWLYSTVGWSFDGAGVFQGFSANLYSINLGAQDTVLGQLGEWETNMRNNGKMDGDQRFIAYYHGFRVDIDTPPGDAADSAALSSLIRGRVGSIFSTGAETRQLWGPIMNQPLGEQSVGGVVGPTSAGPVSAAFALGQFNAVPATHKCHPPVILEPNETFSVRLVLKSRGIQTDTAFANADGTIQHAFIGETQTIVDG